VWCDCGAFLQHKGCTKASTTSCVETARWPPIPPMKREEGCTWPPCIRGESGSPTDCPGSGSWGEGVNTPDPQTLPATTASVTHPTRGFGPHAGCEANMRYQTTPTQAAGPCAGGIIPGPVRLEWSSSRPSPCRVGRRVGPTHSGTTAQGKFLQPYQGSLPYIFFDFGAGAGHPP